VDSAEAAEAAEACQRVERDLLLGAARVDRVGSREISQIGEPAAGQGQPFTGRMAERPADRAADGLR